MIQTTKATLKGVHEGHTKHETEPGTRDLRRKNMVKTIKRLK